MPTRAARSVSEIVRANVFTRINAILGVLFVIVLATGSLINGLFGLLIIANSAIGIVQETAGQADVGQACDRRAGQAAGAPTRAAARELLPSEVVLDDIIELGPGDQVVVDGVVVEESNLEIDESLLTGEADPIDKDAGDPVMSGSFVVAGSGAYRATRVGREAYAAKLAEEASKFTLVKSELRNGINTILRFITYLLIPAGLLIIYTQLFTTERGLAGIGAADGRRAGADGARRAGAADVDRVRGRRDPAGPPAVPRAGTARDRGAGARRRGVRRQDRNADRERDAGAETTPSAKPVERSSGSDVRRAGVARRRRQPAQRQHAAIAEAYDDPPGWTATAIAPFKSATKWSGVSYREHGNWVIGAPDVLLDPSSPVAEQAEEIGAQGLRVLLLASADVPGRPPGGARAGHARRAGDPRAADPARRPRHTGLLCVAECFGQGDLR